MTEQLRPAALPLVPETAPFTPAQRAWLNGFFAGLLGAGGSPVAAADVLPGAAPAPGEDFPWHDAALPLAERMTLAEGRPLARRLMAAMAQLDCGQCGYLCQTYAEALASGAETSPARCVPGGRETARQLKALLAEQGGAQKPGAKPAKVAAPGAHRDAPVTARLFSRDVLSKPGSAKEVRHIALAQDGLAYEVGDSLGVWPENCPELVEAICGRLGASDVPVACPDGAVRPLAEALRTQFDIARPSDDAIAMFRDRAVDDEERAKLEALLDGSAGDDLAEIDLYDLLTSFRCDRVAPEELAASLAPLQPRLYSIASSPKAHPGEVHLTVSVVRWARRGRARKGVASTFLADRAAGELRVFVQRAHAFGLAPDDAPIVMIGPGTGIAPFRAFLEERAARGARGRSWLFFGDQRRATDFLYEEDLAALSAKGVLTRLDLAFSRDQLRKIYVQDRMRESAAELWSWLAEGAYVYVCGDAKRMARDVHRALVDIASEQGRMPLHEAEQWIAALGRDGRYRRDVY